jgi:hypothetical protein
MAVMAALLLAPWAPAAILDEGTGIIYGSDHAFSLRAPKGWVLDNESAVDQGIRAVFYPKGSSWADSKVVAYARARPKTDKITNADDVAKAVVEDFHAHGSPKYEGKKVQPLKTESGREAVIYHFSGDQWGNSEAVAYFVEDKTVNFLVFTSRDAKTFADSLPAFEALAKSYIFMGDHPIVEKEGAAPKKAAPKKKSGK